MKRWYVFVLSLLVCASYLCGYASPQDRQYVDYFLHLQAADLFRTKAFLLNWSCAYINVNSLQGVDFSFSCYRTLSLNEARSLLISVGEELVDKINKDPSIKERCLLPEPFTLSQLCLKIETENVFSAQADPETIRVMILDRGNITYESYRASTLFYGRTVTSRETLEMALMLLGKAPPFGKEPGPTKAAEGTGFKASLPPKAPTPRVEVAAPESSLQGSQPVRYVKEISPPSEFPKADSDVPLSESTSVYWEDTVPPEPQWIQQIRATGGLASFTGSAAPSQTKEVPVERASGPSGTARWAESEGLNAPAEPPKAVPEEPAAAPRPLPPSPEPAKVESPVEQPTPPEKKLQGPTGVSNGFEDTVQKVLPRFHDLWRQVFPQPPESSPKPAVDKGKDQRPVPKTYDLWREEFPKPVESPVEEPSQPPEESAVQELPPSSEEPSPSSEEPPISVEVMRSVQVVFIQEQLFPLPIWNGWQLKTFAEARGMAEVADAGQKTPPDDISKIIAHPPHEVLVPTPIESSESDSWSIDRWFEEMGLVPKEEPSESAEEDSSPPSPSEPASTPAGDSQFASADEAVLPEPLPAASEPQASVEESSPAPVKVPPESMPADVLPLQPRAEEPSSASGGWFSWLIPSSSSKAAPDIAMPPAADDRPVSVEIPPESVPADVLPPQPKAEESSPSPASGGWFSWLNPSSSAPDIAMPPAEDDRPVSVEIPPESVPADVLPPQPKAEESSPSPASGGWFPWLNPSSSAPDIAMPPAADDRPVSVEIPPESVPADVLPPQPEAEEPSPSPASGGWFSWLKPSSSVPDIAMPPAEDDRPVPVEIPSESVEPADVLPPQPKAEEPAPSPTSGGWFSWLNSSSSDSDIAMPPTVDDYSQPEPAPIEDSFSTPVESEPLPVEKDFPQPQPEPTFSESSSPAPTEPESVDFPQSKAEESFVDEWFSWLAPPSSTEPVLEAHEEAAPLIADGHPSVEKNSGAEEGVTESDEEILAWVERFGSWAREKIPDESVLDQLKIPETSQPAAVEAALPIGVSQLDELARSEELLGADIAERLGDVTRPDEVWKDLDQDDYCPDDTNGEDRPIPEPSLGKQEPIAERLGDVVRPDEVWKDLDQDDSCPSGDEDLDEDVSYFNRSSRV